MTQRTFVFNRREVLDTTIYVRASSLKEARQLIEARGADDASDPKHAYPPTYRHLPKETFD